MQIRVFLLHLVVLPLPVLDWTPQVPAGRLTGDDAALPSGEALLDAVPVSRENGELRT